MAVFDFMCDASVGISIEAKDYDAALSLWRDFCHDVNQGNCTYGQGVGQFQVRVSPQATSDFSSWAPPRAKSLTQRKGTQ